ncbi:alanine/glycine:cation symporter family protein [Metabacillus rhizolycopersici]|uniref:Alanine:cation symporter family protein n=1 Tax=Metabacillus rhizolycopersici TaxID=2875709 RepID=A0ABS7UMX6_9BACI|nr:alanine/glycine:cation symporter family protein [Metabacillus rhizolycopersici]MBZ5749661.1 alanine:cation symporter family protein [Metabacillus rhizolycopersici]
MLEQLVTNISNFLWSTPMIIFCVVVGLYFTVRTNFLQIRHVKEMVNLLFKGKSSDEGVSSFQALSLALSGRIGVGNISGTATAIAFGGPGAVFWMWVIAFVGAASAFVESTLAQIYKEKNNGEYRGGPAYYIEKGLGWKWYAVLFSIATLIAMAILMPGVQSNSIAVSIDNAFHIDTTITGLVLVIILALIIFGGIKRIVNVAQFVVPFMALAYILVALYVIVINFSDIPAVFSLIFTSALGADSLFGGIIGSAIAWGVKRGLYASEAGQGTGAHPAAAAEVSHPAKQGLVQAFSIYLDVFLVCTATAFMILFSGAYNTIDESTGEYLVQNITGVEEGPGYTQAAVDSVFPGFGSGFVAIALFFFAFTTIMAYYYIAETNLAYLIKGRFSKIASNVLKIVLLGATFYGAVKEATLAWTLGDIGLGVMVWLNLIAILLLSKPAFIALKDYDLQKKQGLDPTFNSTKLGIKNADFWANGYEIDENKQDEQIS